MMINPSASRGAGRMLPRPGESWRDQVAGWLFCLPVIALIILFLIIPILLALWVSFSDWSGIGSPLSSTVHSVGLSNYKEVLTRPGLSQQEFGESLRNNLYYVLTVVPIQTILALVLAVFVSRKQLIGRGFFRSAYYFPSVTSSVAIAIVFQFLFSGTGTINVILKWLGVNGPNWFNDPQGVIQNILGAVGINNGPHALTAHGFLGVTWWQWVSGPSVAMCALIILAIWTTSGTFMLIFLPALYNISGEIEEASEVDGANAWQKFWRITVPLVKPALVMVITLGIIGTWQVFDSVFLITSGEPEGTTLTPAYLAYTTSFSDQAWGQGAAIAFLLFIIIIVFTAFQRFVLRDRDTAKARKAERRRLRAVRHSPAIGGTR
jgi:multiple sugar transport system permease protein